MSAGRSHRRAMGAAHATAREDQITAAAKDAARFLARAGQALGATPRWSVGAGWAETIATERILALATGRASTCPHLGSPTPVLVPSWAPVVVCSACWVTVPVLGGNDEEDRRCDACGEVVEAIYPVMVAIGALLVLGGLCQSCRTVELAQAARRWSV